MALYCTVFDILDFEQRCDLEIHSRSSKLVPFDTLPTVSCEHPIITVSKMHCFDLFVFEKQRDLETQFSSHFSTHLVVNLGKSYQHM